MHPSDETMRVIRAVRSAAVALMASGTSLMLPGGADGRAAAQLVDFGHIRGQEGLPKGRHLAGYVLEAFREPGYWTPENDGHFASFMLALALVLDVQIAVLHRHGPSIDEPIKVYGAHVESGLGRTVQLTTARSGVRSTVPAFTLRTFEEVLQMMAQQPGTCAVLELSPDHFDPFLPNLAGGFLHRRRNLDVWRKMSQLERFCKADEIEHMTMTYTTINGGFKIRSAYETAQTAYETAQRRRRRRGEEEEEEEEIAHAVLPETLTEPMIYVSRGQAFVVADCLPSIAEAIERIPLPAWVPKRLLGDDMGSETASDGVERALREQTGGRHFVWATEFGIWRSTFVYDEPELCIDGIWYRDAYDYYDQHQCQDDEDMDRWEAIMDVVMMTVLRAKLAARPALRTLLLATGDHPLLSIMNGNGTSRYWGFDADHGGRNRLAELWMELRAEVREFAALKRCVGA